MIPKSINDITAADLQSLIENEVGERKTLDYKRELPGDSRAERIEFLADVSSFANTQGGDLIFGIDAPVGGLPVGVPGLKVDDLESLKLRLEGRIRDGVSRRLSVELHHVPLEGGTIALIVRVPRSWIGPHRVILEGHGHFYARNSSGKYRLDVDELQAAFTLSETFVEKVRDLRLNRVMALKAGESPLCIDDGPKLVLHLVPLSALFATPQSALHEEFAAFVQSHLIAYKPLGNPSSWNHCVNMDGRLIYIATGDGTPSGRSYTQLFRSGVTEAVNSLHPVRKDSKAYLLCRQWTADLRNFLRLQLSLMAKRGLGTPVYVFLSLVDVKGYHLSDEFFRGISNTAVPREDILLPEVAVNTIQADVDELLRPLLTILWNAAGEERCPHFDKEGKWTGPQ